jgi:hypothetical protein
MRERYNNLCSPVQTEPSDAEKSSEREKKSTKALDR